MGSMPDLRVGPFGDEAFVKGCGSDRGASVSGHEIGEGEPTEVRDEGGQKFALDLSGIPIRDPPRDQEFLAVGQLPGGPSAPVTGIVTSTLADKAPHATLEVGAGR